jgi:hypothetical protein
MHRCTAPKLCHILRRPMVKTLLSRHGSAARAVKRIGSDYSAAARLTIAALTAGITFSAINSMDRRDNAGSAQSLPQ